MSHRRREGREAKRAGCFGERLPWLPPTSDATEKKGAGIAAGLHGWACSECGYDEPPYTHEDWDDERTTP